MKQPAGSPAGFFAVCGLEHPAALPVFEAVAIMWSASVNKTVFWLLCAAGVVLAVWQYANMLIEAYTY